MVINMKPPKRISKLSERFRKSLKTDYAAGNGIVRSAKSIHLAASCIMLISGILLCVVEDFDSNVVQWITAGCCILLGVADIFGYYSNDLFRLAFQFAFAFGSYSVLVGVLLLLIPDRLIGFLPYTVACYVILDGLQKVQIALEGRKFGLGKWVLILATSIAVVLFGYLSVFLSHDGSHLWMGIAVALNGAENFWTTMYTVRLRTKTKE